VKVLSKWSENEDTFVIHHHLVKCNWL